MGDPASVAVKSVVMFVSLYVWHAMGAVLSWFTFHLSGLLLETVDILKRCGVSTSLFSRL